MELPGININIGVNGQAVSSGLKGVKGELQGLGTEAEKTATRMQSAGTTMGGSMKGLALGMSQTATSAFSLYQSFDNLEKKQYQVEKANLAAKKATEALDQAQKDYNDAVAKYGVNSIEAADAQDKLALAEETETLAKERADLSQKNLNDSMTSAALMVIPGVISGIDGLSRTWKTFSQMDPAGLAGKLKDAFGALGSNKIGILAGVGLGFGSLLTTYKAFTATTKEEKDLWTGLAMAMNALTVAEWALNAAKAFGVALTPVVGLGIVAAAGAAALATWALAQQFGAKTEAPPEAPTAPGIGAAVGGGWGGTPNRPLTAAESLKAGELKARGLKPGTEAWYEAGGPGMGYQEMPTGPAGEMTVEEMAGAGLGEYTRQTGLFVPNEEMLVRDNIAFKVSQGPNVGKYKWVRRGPAEDEYFTMEDFERIRRGDYSADYERDMRPWFTYGFEEKADALGNVYLVGRHFQEGGWAMTPQLAIVGETPEVMLTEPRLDDLAKRLGGGGTYNVTFNVNGARDVDLVMDEIAKKWRLIGGVGH